MKKHIISLSFSNRSANLPDPFASWIFFPFFDCWVMCIEHLFRHCWYVAKLFWLPWQPDENNVKKITFLNHYLIVLVFSEQTNRNSTPNCAKRSCLYLRRWISCSRWRTCRSRTSWWRRDKIRSDDPEDKDPQRRPRLNPDSEMI